MVMRYFRPNPEGKAIVVPKPKPAAAQKQPRLEMLQRFGDEKAVAKPRGFDAQMRQGEKNRLRMASVVAKPDTINPQAGSSLWSKRRSVASAAFSPPGASDVLPSKPEDEASRMRQEQLTRRRSYVPRYAERDAQLSMPIDHREDVTRLAAEYSKRNSRLTWEELQQPRRSKLEQSHLHPNVRYHPRNANGRRASTLALIQESVVAEDAAKEDGGFGPPTTVESNARREQIFATALRTLEGHDELFGEPCLQPPAAAHKPAALAGVADLSLSSPIAGHSKGGSRHSPHRHQADGEDAYPSDSVVPSRQASARDKRPVGYDHSIDERSARLRSEIIGRYDAIGPKRQATRYFHHEEPRGGRSSKASAAAPPALVTPVSPKTELAPGASKPTEPSIPQTLVSNALGT